MAPRPRERASEREMQLEFQNIGLAALLKVSAAAEEEEEEEGKLWAHNIEGRKIWLGKEKRGHEKAI